AGADTVYAPSCRPAILAGARYGYTATVDGRRTRNIALALVGGGSVGIDSALSTCADRPQLSVSERGERPCGGIGFSSAPNEKVRSFFAVFRNRFANRGRIRTAGRNFARIAPIRIIQRGNESRAVARVGASCAVG